MKKALKKILQLSVCVALTAAISNAFADAETDSPATTAPMTGYSSDSNAGANTDASYNGDSDSDSSGSYNRHNGYFVSGNLGTGIVDEISKSGTNDAGFTGFGGGLNLGDQFTPNFGAELGASIYSLAFSTLTMYDLVAKGVLPLNQRGEFFGKLGVGLARLRVCVLGCDSHERVGPAFGLGFAYNFTHRWAGTLEYNGIYLSSPYSKGIVGALTIGATRHFDA
jgi:opacity protein-like surface antigen